MMNEVIQSIEKPELAKKIEILPGAEFATQCAMKLQEHQILQGKDPEVYFVGGSVRDILLGEVPKDIDLGTSLSPEEIIGILPEAKFVSSAEAYPVIVAKDDKNEHQIEIATFRKDVYHNAQGETRRPDEISSGTIIDDAQRRDFTCNALYLDPVNLQLIFVDDENGHNGLDDINNKILRFVGDPTERLKEDPIRLLRAFRFKNRLGFSFDPSTWNAICEFGQTVEFRSGDRVRKEITAMLKLSSRVEALRDLDKSGLLQKLLPEFCAGKGLEQPPEFHAEGDVFTHQLLVMNYLPEKSSETLVWAALLHDIGKKETFEKVDRIRFNGHAQKSAEMVDAIAQRFRFPNDLKKSVQWLIENHMTIRSLPDMKHSKQIDFFSNPNFQDLLELLKADDKASYVIDNQGSPSERTDLSTINRIASLYQQYQKEVQAGKPMELKDIGVDGKLIIEWLGIDPKDRTNLPKIGNAQRYLTMSLRNNEISSMEDARRAILENNSEV